MLINNNSKLKNGTAVVLSYLSMAVYCYSVTKTFKYAITGDASFSRGHAKICLRHISSSIVLSLILGSR